MKITLTASSAQRSLASSRPSTWPRGTWLDSIRESLICLRTEERLLHTAEAILGDPDRMIFTQLIMGGLTVINRFHKLLRDLVLRPSKMSGTRFWAQVLRQMWPLPPRTRITGQRLSCITLTNSRRKRMPLRWRFARTSSASASNSKNRWTSTKSPRMTRRGTTFNTSSTSDLRRMSKKRNRKIRRRAWRSCLMNRSWYVTDRSKSTIGLRLRLSARNVGMQRISRVCSRPISMIGQTWKLLTERRRNAHWLGTRSRYCLELCWMSRRRKLRRLLNSPMTFSRQSLRKSTTRPVNLVRSTSAALNWFRRRWTRLPKASTSKRE